MTETTDVSAIAKAVADEVADRLGLVGPMLSTSRVAEMLGISDRTVREMVRRGVLPSVKVEGARRIDAAAVRRYLEERREDVEVGADG